LANQFELWDENADGMVYPAEIKEYYERFQRPMYQRIAIAAMSQGSELFSKLDINADQRLSLREMKDAAATLKSIDRDGDEAISLGESPVTIRLAIARGNETYQYLNKGLLSRPPPRATNDNIGQGPAWFIRMDTNGDGDVTRREFLGDDEQFQRLDANGDGVVEVKEAPE
jgi:Ca2+-binding EF-hand superfamily protein